jgi:ADP-ribosylglycohydrolase
MQAIPAEVREYLSTSDSLYRAQVVQRYPDLQQTLNDPATRKAILDWLTSDEAWEPSLSSFTSNSLALLRVGAAQEEAQIVRSFLLHPDPWVRLSAYDFLLTLYFPDRNREAMFLLLHGMLSDNDDMVRAQAARYIERADAVDELRDFLQRWYKEAPGRGWADTESFELVGGLLNS